MYLQVAHIFFEFFFLTAFQNGPHRFPEDTTHSSPVETQISRILTCILSPENLEIYLKNLHQILVFCVWRRAREFMRLTLTHSAQSTHAPTHTHTHIYTYIYIHTHTHKQLLTLIKQIILQAYAHLCYGTRHLPCQVRFKLRLLKLSHEKLSCQEKNSSGFICF